MFCFGYVRVGVFEYQSSELDVMELEIQVVMSIFIDMGIEYGFFVNLIYIFNFCVIVLVLREEEN